MTYNNKGYGFLEYHGSIIPGWFWLDCHLQRFPGGVLPRQELELFIDGKIVARIKEPKVVKELVKSYR